MAGSMDLRATLTLVDHFSGAMRGPLSAINQLASAAGRAAPGFGTLSAAMAVGTLGATALIRAVDGIAGALGDTIGAAAAFESSLNTFQAVSGATGDQMERAGKLAQQLGADMTLPATSAADAAKAMTELVRAGVSVEDAFNATRGALQLAAAAQIDEAAAAKITAAALNTFGLAGTEAARVADMLAVAANASAADVSDLAQGMQQAGFIFKATGRPIEELVSSLATLSNAGLTGSDAGTALKNAFMRMIDPTKEAAGVMKDLGISFFDAQGNLKPLPDIVDTLNGALSGMTQEQRTAALTTLFMSDGFKALQPLLEKGGDSLRTLQRQLARQGAAAELAGAKTKGLQGAFDGLKSQVETLQITLGRKLGPALEGAVRFLAAFVGEIGNAAERLDFSALFAGIADFGANLGKALFAGGNAVAEFADHVLARLPLIGPLFQSLGNVIGSAMVGIAAVMRGDAKGATEALGEAFRQLGQGAAPELTAGVTSAQAALLGFATVIQESVVPPLVELAPTLAVVAAGIAGFLVINTVVGAVIAATAAFAALGPAIAAAGGALPLLIAILGGPVTVAIAAVVAAITLLGVAWVNNWGDIQSITASVSAAVVAFLQPVFAELSRFSTEIAPLVAAAWANIQAVITAAMAAILADISAAMATLVSLWQANHTSIEAQTSTSWSAIAGIITAQWTIIQGLITAGLQVLAGDWQGAWTTMQSTTTSVMAQIQGAVSSSMAALQAAVVGGWNSIAGSLQGIWNSLIGAAASAGAGMVSAFANAVTSRAQAALDAVRRLVEQTRALLPGSDAKVGPLSDLTASGRALPETLATGIRQAAPSLTKAVRDSIPPISMGALYGKQGRPIAPSAPSGGSTSNASDQSRHVTINVYGGDRASARNGALEALFEMQRAGLA